MYSRDLALRRLKYRLSRAQEYLKGQADKHRRPSNVQVGDWVYLKIWPHRQGSSAEGIHLNLAECYFRPFLVTKQMESKFNRAMLTKWKWRLAMEDRGL